MVLKLVAYPLNGVKAAFVDCLGNLFLGSYTFSSVRLLFERHDVHTVIKSTQSDVLLNRQLQIESWYGENVKLCSLSFRPSGGQRLLDVPRQLL